MKLLLVLHMGVWTDVGCQNLTRVHEVLSVGLQSLSEEPVHTGGTWCRRSEPQEGAEDSHTVVARCRDWSPGKVSRVFVQEGRLTWIARANGG